MNWIFSKKLWGLLFAVTFTVGIQAQNPNWIPPSSADYSFSANAVTTISLYGLQSNDLGDQIAIFSGEELRGLSQAVDAKNQGILHFITLYSNIPTELMSIRIYHQATDLVYDVATPIEFEVQQIYGSVDAPMVLNIYDGNDAPIFFNTVPFQTTYEGMPFVGIDMLDYLVQVDDQSVTWSYTANPNLSVIFSGSVLQVAGVPDFSGYTTLTVRATELPANSLDEDSDTNKNLSRSIATQYAETTIGFFITEAYAGPAWNMIPNQGIVIGSQFTPVNLHDYEYQYEGPSIQYDYAPIVVESDPPKAKPTWTFSGNFSTTMNIIARIDYTPKYQFQHEDDILAVFVNEELRGTATLDSISKLYYISVGGLPAEKESVSIKFYSGSMKKVFDLSHVFNYESYKIIGSVESPYLLEFAPIIPVVSDYPIPGGIFVMPVSVADTNYVGTEFFEFYAFDPEYPAILNDTIETSFCIVLDSSELTSWYVDSDGDGLGDPNEILTTCGSVPTGYVNNSDDCDDTNAIDPNVNITVLESSGIPDDGLICANSPVTISADDSLSYLWSTGEITSAIMVVTNISSTHSVTVTFPSGCKGVNEATIMVEGKVVNTDQNDGFGSLRNVIECLIPGDTITYDQPIVAHSILTTSLVIDKDLSIHGYGQLNRPEIQLDNQNGLNSITIELNRNVTFKNLVIKSILDDESPLIINKGNLEVMEIVRFW